MARRRIRGKSKAKSAPTPGWAVYLRTSSDENQKPELSRARQRYAIENNVLNHSDMPVYAEYIDVLTGSTPHRKAYQQLLDDARTGEFSHVIVERADRFGRNDTEALRAIDELHDFGVAVRFANQPDLDPMDPDDRVLVALTFTLARRESALLGLRVRGGVKAKRESGGFHGRAPDGYLNKNGLTSGEAKKRDGRVRHWIELDPDRAPIWRYAWDLLLEGNNTLENICEALHTRGYRYKSGRPFITIKPNGKRVINANTLSSIFHNWTYAGWVTSKRNNVLPKTIRGDWEPLVTTEELEAGIKILEKRDHNRGRHRRFDYLLKGIVYYESPEEGLIKLTCSTSNSSRAGGGTAYYCQRRSSVNFMCSAIDDQIAGALHNIQVDPELIPLIHEAYTEELAERLGHLEPGESKELENSLKGIKDEESRMARLFATGKISEDVWDSMWREWQDRRSQINQMLQSLESRAETHIINLDQALEIITRIGIVYNKLSRDDKKQILRHMVERVIIDPEGTIRLDLRAPFAYLRGIFASIDEDGKGFSTRTKTKTGQHSVTGRVLGQRSDSVLLCGEDRIRTCGTLLAHNRLAGGPNRPLWHLPLTLLIC